MCVSIKWHTITIITSDAISNTDLKSISTIYDYIVLGIPILIVIYLENNLSYYTVKSHHYIIIPHIIPYHDTCEYVYTRKVNLLNITIYHIHT